MEYLSLHIYMIQSFEAEFYIVTRRNSAISLLSILAYFNMVDQAIFFETPA